MSNLTIIVPVFNERESIEQTLRDLSSYDVIIVDDCSTDGTSDILEDLQSEFNFTLIRHPINKGYSASIKTGIHKSEGDVIGIVDADGTYPIQDFSKLEEAMAETHADMVIGQRRGHIPFVRRPAKFIVNTLANVLAGKRIPDLNCGMRIFTRKLAMRYMHLYPQRFSFTITITLAALTDDYIVHWVPIQYFKRTGKSTLGFRSFLEFLGLIVRIMTYFRPLRFFTLPSIVLFSSGVALTLYTTTVQQNISDAGLLLMLSGMQTGFFGLVAEVIVRNNRAIR